VTWRATGDGIQTAPLLSSMKTQTQRATRTTCARTTCAYRWSNEYRAMFASPRFQGTWLIYASSTAWTTQPWRRSRPKSTNGSGAQPSRAQTHSNHTSSQVQQSPMSSLPSLLTFLQGCRPRSKRIGRREKGHLSSIRASSTMAPTKSAPRLISASSSLASCSMTQRTARPALASRTSGSEESCGNRHPQERSRTSTMASSPATTHI
jgi:hypothetical protein